jgi:hypothetical protein
VTYGRGGRRRRAHRRRVENGVVDLLVPPNEVLFVLRAYRLCFGSIRAVNWVVGRSPRSDRAVERGRQGEGEEEEEEEQIATRKSLLESRYSKVVTQGRHSH